LKKNIESGQVKGLKLDISGDNLNGSRIVPIDHYTVQNQIHKANERQIKCNKPPPQIFHKIYRNLSCFPIIEKNSKLKFGVFYAIIT
jgi:hypothetical protein